MEEHNIAVEESSPSALSSDVTASAAVEDERFDTLDYVKELFLNSLEQKKADKKKIRLMRICVALMAVIAVTLIVAVIAAGPYIQSIVSDFHDITQKVVEIDTKTILADAQKLITETSVTMQSAGETLDKLDIDALNTAIQDLGEKVSSMDMESLNEAIESLNNVVTTLSNTWPFKR